MENSVFGGDIAQLRNTPFVNINDISEERIKQYEQNHAPRGKHAGDRKYSDNYAWLNTRPERFDYVKEEAMTDSRYKHIKSEASYGGPVGFLGKSKVEILKRVTAIAITMAAGVGTIAYSAAQADSFNKATEVVEVVDLPNEAFNEYDLQVRANGTATFIDAEGNTMQQYNGMNANDIASSYSQTSGHTR